MSRIYIDNFSTTLGESVSTGDVSFDLTDASGLGTIPGGDFVACTIDDNAGNREIIHVTARSSNTITCTRGQEGTAAANWASGITIEARLTADAMDEKLDIADASAGALTFIAASTASSSADLHFTGLGDYSYVEFVFTDVLPATDDVEFWMRTSTNNGSSYDSAASDYNWAHLGRTGATTQAVSSSAEATMRLCQAAAGLDVSNVANEGISGHAKLYNPTGTAYRRMTYQIGFINGNAAPATYTGSGARLTGADVDAVQFLFSSGNIASGTIYAYGLAKS